VSDIAWWVSHEVELCEEIKAISRKPEVHNVSRASLNSLFRKIWGISQDEYFEAAARAAQAETA
jgi:hypothetical protein